MSREERMVVVKRKENGVADVWCDPEIVDLVTALNDGGIRTVASCSGHGWRPGNIILEDGRQLFIVENPVDQEAIEKLFPYNINGELRDAG